MTQAIQIIDVAIDLKTRFDAFLSDESEKTYPVRSIWMSSLGHPCLRYLVHNILDHDKKAPFPVAATKRMIAGREEEEITLNLLRKIGCTIIRQQEHAEVDIPNSKFWKISGRAEGVLLPPFSEGAWLLYEIKSVDPNTLYKINSIEDLFCKHWAYQRYSAQGQLYMAAKSYPEMLFILKARGLADMKIFPYAANRSLQEDLVNKAAAVVSHVEAETFPNPINDPAICSRCEFAHICPHELPVHDLSKSGIVETNLADLCQQRAEVEQSHREFVRIDRELKDTIKESPEGEYLIGEYLIQRKPYQRIDYQIPEEVKGQYKTSHSCMRTTITMLGDD